MKDKFLLYIDMLAFSELVRKRGAVKKLYKVIDTLNVHKHDQFKTIVFSDTILVYNQFEPQSDEDVNYILMFLCEFAQDLFYRLIGKDMHFRAYIAHGDFAHYDLQNIECFYGMPLVEAHQHTKEIQCTGLFMEKGLVRDSDIFKTAPYDDKCHFVHLMQDLDHIRFKENEYPIDPILIESMGMEYLIAYDFTYLKNIYQHMQSSSIAPHVRVKYGSTWQMIGRRHRGLMMALERSNFDPQAICKMGWSEAMRRVGTREGFHG